MSKKTIRYDDEFKAHAVKMVVEQNRTPTEEASDLGVSQPTIRRWVKQTTVLEVSRIGYYDWLDGPPSKRAKRHSKILKEIKRIYQKHPSYGLDPIWTEIKETIPCSRGTVYRLIKKHCIRSKRNVKWKATTNSEHNLPVAPNLVNQVFDSPIPNSGWVGDITTDEGWLYTTIVKDLCTKEVVGHVSDKRKYFTGFRIFVVYKD